MPGRIQGYARSSVREGWRSAAPSDAGASAPVVMSGVALVAALAALVMAATTLFVVRGEGDVAAEPSLTPSAQPTETPPVSPSPTETTETPEPTDESSTTSASGGPLPSVDAEYTLSYQDVKMTLISNGNYRDVDFDQPLVNSTGGQTDARILFSSTPELRFESTDVAVGKSVNVTPAECAKAIQLSPSPTTVKVSQDLVLCAVTNGQGAVNEPARAKVARIVVNAVGGDGTTSLTLTAWELPH